VPGALVIADLARPIGAGRLAARQAPAGAHRNGHTRPPVVPAQAPTPIFEHLVTSWFTEPKANPVTHRTPEVPGADRPAAAPEVEWPGPAEPPAASAPQPAVVEKPADQPDRAGRAETPAAGRPASAEKPVDSVDRATRAESFAAAARTLAERAGRAEKVAAPADRTSSDRATGAGTPAAGWPTSAEKVAAPADRTSPDRATRAETPAGRPTSAEKPLPPAARTARPDRTPRPDWTTPADEARQAAESALKPAVQQLTEAGLPTRRPGAQLAPGAVVPRGRAQAGGAFRDPAAVRASLSRHYQGMRAARLRTAARPEPAEPIEPAERAGESGKDEVDPR
jgi:hypothetical protein